MDITFELPYDPCHGDTTVDALPMLTTRELPPRPLAFAARTSSGAKAWTTRSCPKTLMLYISATRSMSISSNGPNSATPACCHHLPLMAPGIHRAHVVDKQVKPAVGRVSDRVRRARDGRRVRQVEG